jgi:hypothetical protein
MGEQEFTRGRRIASGRGMLYLGSEKHGIQHFLFLTHQIQTPCSFGLISRISSHPAVLFSHNKPANSAFSTINQRNEQAEKLLEVYFFLKLLKFGS